MPHYVIMSIMAQTTCNVKERTQGGSIGLIELTRASQTKTGERGEKQEGNPQNNFHTSMWSIQTYTFCYTKSKNGKWSIGISNCFQNRDAHEKYHGNMCDII